MVAFADMPARKRRLVCYLGGPYRDKRGVYYITRNIEEARHVAAQLWAMGFACLCPHMNTNLLDGMEGTQDDTFLDGDLDMIERCDLFIAMPRWQQSTGTKAEREHALAVGLPVFVWDEPGVEDQLRAAAQAQLNFAPVPMQRPVAHTLIRSHTTTRS